MNRLCTPTCDMDKHEGQNAYTAYEVTFNKNFSKGWSFLAGFTVDLGSRQQRHSR